MKKILRFVLALLFLSIVAISAQTTSKMYVIEGSAQFLEGELIDREIKDANGEVCAGVIIISDMQGLSFQSYNGIVKTNSNPGRHFIFVSPTERVVEVFKSGYEPLKIILNDYGINLKSGTTWQIKITGDKIADIIPVNILTTPSDAEVFVDNKLEKTGNTFQMQLGKHVVVVKLKGYKQILDTINVSLNNNFFNYKLSKVALEKVTIKSVPQKANIYLGDENKGQTDIEFFNFPGDYKLRLTKLGYITIDTVLTISETNKNIYSFNMAKNIGMLAITTIPENALFSVDGKESKNKTIELFPGQHIIEVWKEKHLSILDTISIKLGDRIEKNYTLLKNTSIISLDVQPVDAEVFINDQRELNKSIECMPGNYNILIKKVGYNPIEDVVTVERDVPFEKRYKLVPKTGSLQLTVAPIEANIELTKGSNVVAAWVGSKILDSLMIGEYQLNVECKGYDSQNKTIFIKEGTPTVEDIYLAGGDSFIEDFITSVKSVSPEIKFPEMTIDVVTKQVKIKYILSGEKDKKYDISLNLKSHISSKFDLEADDLMGDYEDIVGSDDYKTVAWNFSSDVSIYTQNKYSIEISAVEVKSSTWYYWIGGALAAGGAVIAAILLSPSDAPTDSPIDSIPPGRP